MQIVRTFDSLEHGERQEEIACPLCGSAETELVLVGSDLLFGRPGPYRLVRCRGCNLQYVNPRPTGEALGVHYPKEYFGYEKPEDAAWPMREILLSFARGIARRRLGYIEAVTGRIQAGQQLVDVGCGVNGLLRTIREERGVVGLGVDFKPEVVDYVRNTLKMPIVEGTLANAGLETGRFDLMTLLEYIEHEPDPASVLTEARRVIKTGGHLCIEIPHPTGWVARTFGRHWWNLDVPRHLVFYDPETLGKQLALAGFDLVKVTPFTLPFYVGASVLQALGQRSWNRNKHWVPLVAGALGAPFLPFQLAMPEFLFAVARAR
ncbi:MAG: class I SAM-dependent methyltransferase [Deltaproteobacteria bacterium]|nr:class I SAM-dependent methyltransferase [Deltaproteobacteria bacterium]